VSFTEDLRVLIRARYPIIWVETYEEERVLRYVIEVANKPKGDDETAPPKEVVLWSQAVGTETIDAKGQRELLDGALAGEPITALGKFMADVRDEPGKGRIIVMRDMHRFFGDGPTMVTYRLLRDAANALRESSTTIVITSPFATIQSELVKDVMVVPLPLPTADELQVRLDEILEGVEGKIERPKNGQVERILKAGLGLSEDEFAGVVKESLVRSKKVDHRIILKQKEQIIRKSGVVEFFSSVEGLEAVGGLDLLRAWVHRRALASTEKAAKFGLSQKANLLLTGPPGTGKTLTAKATANHLGIPMLWVRSESIFGRFVGESEGNMRRVFDLANAVAPCVLFIDEGEKLFAGSSAGASAGDSGVTRKVLGQLLTYLQERTAPVTVILTANDPFGIPPELMSRFLSGTFFVDFPQPEERLDILNIHLKKVKRDPKNYDLKALVAATDGFSGREIEQGISEALDIAYAEGEGKTELANRHILAAFDGMTPISKSRRAEVEAMRDWAKSNARPASANNRLTSKKVGVDL